MSYPPAEPASPEYAYTDPKTAPYALAKLGDRYHPLDAWKTMGRDQPKLARYLFQIGFPASIALTSFIWYNQSAGRPSFAGLHRMIAFTLFAAGLGQAFYTYNVVSSSRRDAVIQHYLETHYDDFPMIGMLRVLLCLICSKSNFVYRA